MTTEELEFICGHVVKRSFSDEIRMIERAYFIKLDDHLIPQFYYEILKDQFVFNLVVSVSEKESELLIKNALRDHARSSKYFPRPEEIIQLIKYNHYHGKAFFNNDDDCFED